MASLGIGIWQFALAARLPFAYKRAEEIQGQSHLSSTLHIESAQETFSRSKSPVSSRLHAGTLKGLPRNLQKHRHHSLPEVRAVYEPPDDTLIPEPLKVTPKKSKPQSSNSIPTGPTTFSGGIEKQVTVSPGIREKQQLLLRRTGGATAEERPKPRRYEARPARRRATESMVAPTTDGQVKDNIPVSRMKTALDPDPSAAETGMDHGSANITAGVLSDTMTELCRYIEEHHLQLVSRLVIIENQLRRLVTAVDTLSQDDATKELKMTDSSVPEQASERSS